MYSVPIDKRPMLYRFFPNHTDNLIHSCLQGHAGFAVVDSLDSPNCVMLVVADFCFVAGDASCQQAPSLLQSLPNYYDGSTAIAIPCEAGWVERFNQVYGEGCSTITRYSFYKQEQFDTDTLSTYAHTLPHGYSLHPIDAALYSQCLAEGWSSDLCSQFTTAEDYALRGLGYGVLHQGKIAAGASSYVVFDGGIEIEIDTHKDHRRLGLATACGAALILECLKRNQIPSWDAANLSSVSLAEKLGYRLNKPYTAYLLPIR